MWDRLGATRTGAHSAGPVRRRVRPGEASRASAAEGSTKSGAAGAAASGSGPSAGWTPTGRAEPSSTLSLQRRALKEIFPLLRAFTARFPANMLSIDSLRFIHAPNSEVSNLNQYG